MSKRMTRRRFTQVMTATSAGMILAACAPKTATEPPAPEAPGQPPAEAAKQTTAPEKPIVEITVAYGVSGAGPKSDAPAFLRAGEATRTRLRLQTVGSADWTARRNTLLATGQVPDIMSASPINIRDFATPAILHPIMPLVEQYAPDLKRYLEAYPEVERWKIEGELYNIPRVYFNRPKYAPVVNLRMDWVEAAGLAKPTNFDELYEVLTELKKAHPDAFWTNRGGIKRMLMLMAYPMGSGMGGWFRGPDVPYFDPSVDGGKWLYGPIHPEFKEVLAYFARAYKEGILDPDVASTTTDQWHQLNSSGKSFFTYDNFTFVRRWLLALREVDPGASWMPVHTPEGMRGRRQNDFFTFEGGWCIGAGTKDPQRVIELLNWYVTPEGIDTSNWGIEGEHYTLKCPRPERITDYTREGLAREVPCECREFTPELLAAYPDDANRRDDHGVGLANLSILIDGCVLPYFDPPTGEFEEIIAIVASDPGLHQELIVPPLTKDEIDRLRDPQANVSAVIDPALDKMVLGQMTMAEYDQVVQDAIRAGAQIIEDIYNEAEARMS